MKPLLWTIALWQVGMGLCHAQTPLLPDPIEVNPPMSPQFLAEQERNREAFRKADKPTRDLLEQAIKLRDKGNLAAAEANCRKALTLVIRSEGHIVRPDIYQFLGELLLRAGRYNEALQAFDQWITERTNNRGHLGLPSGISNDVTVRLELALAYCLRGNYQVALNHYTDPLVEPLPSRYARVTDFAKDDVLNGRTLAGLHAALLLQFALNRQSATWTDTEALRCMREAARIRPNSPVAALIYADTLYDRGRHAESVRYYRVVAARGFGSDAEKARRIIDAETKTRD